MTIDKALKILEATIKPPIQPWEIEYADAIKLGIEALKWVKQNRYASYPKSIPRLAGETEE